MIDLGRECWCAVCLSPALCDPLDCSPLGSSVHGIFQAEILEWVAMPPPEDLPNPGIEPVSPALQADFLPTETPEKPKECWYYRAIQIVTLVKTHIGWLSQRNSSKVYFLPLMLQKVDFFLKSGLSIITLWINIIPWARIVWGEALIMSVFLNISVLVFQGLCNQNSGLWSMLSSWFAFKWMSAQCSVYSPSREDVLEASGSYWELHCPMQQPPVAMEPSWDVLKYTVNTRFWRLILFMYYLITAC